MEQPDPMIHQPVRLKILSALRVLPEAEMLDFVRLKQIVQATDGNLGAHISTLESAHYIQVEKSFAGRKPCTRIRISAAGRRAFEDYVAFLKALIGPAAA